MGNSPFGYNDFLNDMMGMQQAQGLSGFLGGIGQAVGPPTTPVVKDPISIKEPEINRKLLLLEAV